MASNPMQRKARNSFLAGVLITTVILGAVIGLLIWKSYSDKKEQEEIELSRVTAYVLTTDVKAGTNVAEKNSAQVLTPLALTTVEIDAAVAPSSVITLSNFATMIKETSVYKIDLKMNTILTADMLVESDDMPANDMREQEYNMIVLPTYLESDDYVDIRLRMPSGEDYIVVSKKKVVDTNESTIWMHLTEDELLTLSNAIVEAYQVVGSELYATTYTEPGIQQTATTTYVPSLSVINLIRMNPNIVETAKTELANRYNQLMGGRTGVIDPAISAGAEEAQSNVSTGVSTSIENRKQSRTEYLQELEAATTVVE